MQRKLLKISHLHIDSFWAGDHQSLGITVDTTDGGRWWLAIPEGPQALTLLANFEGDTEVMIDDRWLDVNAEMASFAAQDDLRHYHPEEPMEF